MLKSYLPKIRHLGPAYLFALFLAVPGLVILRLMLVEFLPALTIRQEVWELWIPQTFTLVLVVLLLRQRVKILSFVDKTHNRQFVFLALAWLSLSLPSILAQQYVPVAASKLHEVSQIDEIDPDRPHRYYRIESYKVLRQFASSYADISVSGRGKDRMLFSFYFVTPMVISERSIDQTHRYWYGLQHVEGISNRLSDEEKEQLYNRAFKNGVAMVNAQDFFDQTYFEVLSRSSAQENYRKAVAARYGANAQESAVILIPRTGTFEARTEGQLLWLFLSLAIGQALLGAYLLWPTVDAEELGRQQRGDMPVAPDDGGFADFFIPRGRFFAAPVIINAIIVVFLMLLFAGVDPVNPTGGDLLEWGANRRSETVSGQWWRLVSSMFLHGGILHLALNVYGLIIAAMFVEPLFGRARFFLIYFLAGIAGSLASIGWYENTVSIGASGAIFGLFGAIFALALKGILDMKALISMWVFVGISLLFGLTGGIDNAAHIGGLIAGILMGLLLRVVMTPVRRE